MVAMNVVCKQLTKQMENANQFRDYSIIWLGKQQHKVG